MKKAKRITLIVLTMTCLSSCKNYLDIVPDNIATIDYAFQMRSVAERYLFTCYSFLPQEGNLTYGPAMLSGDELWLRNYPWTEFSAPAWEIARGNQNVNNPWVYYWSGEGHDKSLWRGIRECNIFIENIMNVPDMEEYEKKIWLAEAKFLKAYFHFSLLRMFGPIPIVRENTPTGAKLEDVRVERRPVDEVVDYIIELIDESQEFLLDRFLDEISDMGRITRPIALGMKAKILVYAASPLFNGNTDYAGFANHDGTVLFNQQYDPLKWRKAADACKTAIDYCHALGYELHEFQGNQQISNISDQNRIQLNIRTAFTERWNKETIWGDPNCSNVTIQLHATPSRLDHAATLNSSPRTGISVPLKVAAQFYSKNGVPIEEDTEWDYARRFDLRTATTQDRFLIKPGHITARFNFDREMRFYANLGFDGGIWYGQGRYAEDNPSLPNFFLDFKLGKSNGGLAITGYSPKKYVYYTNVLALAASGYSVTDYPWVMLRLADLYLLYAEALNEADGPGAEVYRYIDDVRHRAGLKGVVESWQSFSRTPGKPSQREGLRAIIQQERGIELALEANRFWDLRRWKKAPEVYNMPITGWDYSQDKEEAYYRERILYNTEFSLKDYFWPIKEHDLIVNKNLVQNPGW